MMELISKIDFAILFAALFVMSEGLAMFPKVKANSVFQAVVGVLKFLKDAFKKKEPQA